MREISQIFLFEINKWKIPIQNKIMQKINNIDQRFIHLREIFHEFQTSVRFSTSGTYADSLGNYLKCYQFLGELEQHFVAEKVQYLHQFVSSIFSLIFTMIRQSSSNQAQNSQQQQHHHEKKDIGIQTDQQSILQSKKKPTINFTALPQQQRRKRAFMEIEIFEKDVAEMDFRQRRRALKKMRDAIYEQQEPQKDDTMLKQFRPNIDKIGYSRSDESIRLAIDTLKQSDISTHIFLKHFMSEFPQITDIKNPSQFLGSQIIKSIKKTVSSYRSIKQSSKLKCKLYNHTVQQVIFPSSSLKAGYRISVNFMKNGQGNDNQYKKSSSVKKFALKRDKFPSVLLKPNSHELNVINQARSRSSISSKTSLDSKENKKDIKQSLSRQRPRRRNSLSLGDLNNLLHGTAKINKNKDHPNPTQSKNINKLTRENSKQSVRLSLNGNHNSMNSFVQRQNKKLRQSVGLKKLRKKNSTSYFDKIDSKINNRQSFNQGGHG